MLMLLNNKVARVIELEKISCEYFAEMPFKYIDNYLLAISRVCISKKGSLTFWIDIWIEIFG